MPLNLVACLGVLGGHGRVRVGEKRLTGTVESILQRTQVSLFCLKSVLAILWRRDCLATPSLLCQLQGHYKGSSVDRRTGLFPLNDTLRSWMEALLSALMPPPCRNAKQAKR